MGSVCWFSSLLASLIGCYSYLRSASQPWELQWVINTNTIIGKGYPSRDFIQTWATKKIRRKYEDLPPFSILLSKTLSILQKSKKTQTVKSQHVAGYMTTFQSRLHGPLSLPWERGGSHSQKYSVGGEKWNDHDYIRDQASSHPQQLQGNVILLAKKHKFENSTEDAFWKQRLWEKECLKFDCERREVLHALQFVHFARVPVLSMMWYDLLCNRVDDVTTWRQTFNFSLSSSNRLQLFDSRVASAHFKRTPNWIKKWLHKREVVVTNVVLNLTPCLLCL